MRRMTVRLFAAGFLAAALSQLHPGEAAACSKYDHAAEMTLIDDAIDAPGTSEADRTALIAYRKELYAVGGYLDRRSYVRYSNTTWKALKLIGKSHIYLRDAPSDASAEIKIRRPEDGALPLSCG